MVKVQVSEDDRFDGCYRDVECGELPVDSFVGAYREFKLSSEVPVGEEALGFEITGLRDDCTHTGVDDENPFGMLDDHRPDRQPFGEMGVEDGIDDREAVFQAGFAKSCFIGTRSCREEVEPDGTTPGSEPDGRRWEHPLSVVYCNEPAFVGIQQQAPDGLDVCLLPHFVAFDLDGPFTEVEHVRYLFGTFFYAEEA